MIVGHTHDEIIGLAREAEAKHEIEILIECMTAPMPWAPDLQLKAEGYESKVYKK
jgi:DNA polymerase bacteriophage-type